MRVLDFHLLRPIQRRQSPGESGRSLGGHPQAEICVGLGQPDQEGGVGVGHRGRLVEDGQGLLRPVVLQVNHEEVLVARQGAGLLLDGNAFGLDGPVGLAEARVDETQPGVQLA